MTKKQIAFIIKAATPYITAVVSALVAFIMQHIHVFGALTHNQVAKYVTTAVIFGLSWAITYVSAHTKLIPDIEKWADPLIHDLKPLEPILGELIGAPAQPHISINSPAATVNVTGDANITHEPGGAMVSKPDPTTTDASSI